MPMGEACPGLEPGADHQVKLLIAIQVNQVTRPLWMPDQVRHEGELNTFTFIKLISYRKIS